LQYSLNGGAYQPGNQFSGVSASATPYNITVKDANNCTTETTVTVTEPAGMVLSTAITPETCDGDDDGAIVLTVSGGTPTYTYAWTGPLGYNSTSQNISGLAGGSYTVIVTDSKNCTATTTVTVTITNPDPVKPGEINH